jgi:hypothetical protein
MSTRHAQVSGNWSGLPDSVRTIFPDLEVTDDDFAYCEMAADQLMNVPDRLAFRDRQRCRKLVFDLYQVDVDRVLSDLGELYAHPRSGPAERYIYPRIAAIRQCLDLGARIDRVAPVLLMHSLGAFSEYRAGDPCNLAPYREFFAPTKLVQSLAPEIGTGAHEQFRSEMSPYSRSHPIVPLYLPSLFAWNTSADPSPADVVYLEVWPNLSRLTDPRYAGQHLVGYYSDRRVGLELMRMSERAAAEWRKTHRMAAAEQLIARVEAKCTAKDVNQAWVAATFAKMHVGMQWLEVPYNRLPPPLAGRVRNIVHTTRRRVNSWNARPLWLTRWLTTVENALPTPRKPVVHSIGYGQSNRIEQVTRTSETVSAETALLSVHQPDHRKLCVSGEGGNQAQAIEFSGRLVGLKSV